MSDDILDSLDELEEFDEDSSSDSDLLVIDEDGNELIMSESSDMTENEAKEITEAIRSTVVATYVLLAKAHEGKAYKALGYDTWKDYVKSEFDFSAQRSYQLLDLAKAVDAIESSAPEGYKSSITEAQARDIKRELPRITEEIRENTQDMDPKDASAYIDSLVEDARDKKKADEEVFQKQEADEAADRQQAEYDSLEEQADDLLDADDKRKKSEGSYAEDYDDGELAPGEHKAPVNDEDSLSQRESMNIYNFFNMVNSFDSLPEVQDIIDVIPQEREDEVIKSISALKYWVDDFIETWNDEKN